MSPPYPTLKVDKLDNHNISYKIRQGNRNPDERGDKGIFESMMRLVKIKVVHLCQSLQADVFHLLRQVFLPRAVL